MKAFLLILLGAMLATGGWGAVGHADKIGDPASSIELHGDAPDVRVLP